MRLRKNKKSSYTVVANAVLRDKSLSLRAKGLLALLLSLPDDWDFKFSWIVQQSREGRDAARAALGELRAAGYIVTIPAQDDSGKFTGHDWLISDTPLSTQETAPRTARTVLLENRPTGKPEDGFPVGQTKKEVTKKEVTKKKISSTTTPITTNSTLADVMRSKEAQNRKREYLTLREHAAAVNRALRADAPRLTALHTRLNRADSRKAHEQWVAQILYPRLQEMGETRFVRAVKDALDRIGANPMINNPYAYMSKQLERARAADMTPDMAIENTQANREFIAALMEV